MPEPAKRDQFSLFLGILFFFLINYPFVQIFDRTVLLGGIPLLTLYFFGLWLLAIVALHVLGRRLNLPDKSSTDEQ